MADAYPANTVQINQAILADPDIQRILAAERTKLASTRDKGGSDREYQQGIRDLLTHIAQEKQLIPKGKFFVNPNNGQIEPSRGWAGLNTWQKALSIGGVAAATVATAGAFGAGPAAGLLSGGGGGSAASAGTAAGATGGGAMTTAAIGSGLGGTMLRYGLQYGLPIAGALIGGKMQANADRDATAAQMDYYNRALEAEREEQQYRRGFDEEARGYNRGFAEEARGYDRAQYAESTNASRRNYGNYVQTLEPFRAAGTQANQYAARLLGHSVPEYTGGSYYDLAREASRPVDLPGYGGSSASSAPAGSAPPRSAAQPVSTTQPEPISTTRPEPMSQAPDALVMMRSPNGQQKQIPQSQVAYYQSRGAEVV